MRFDIATPLGLTYALGPDIFVIAGASLLMLVAAFAKNKPNAQRSIGIVAIAVCVAAIALVFGYVWRGTTATDGTIAVDPFRWAVDIIVLLATAGTIALAIEDNEREGIATSETHVLILFATSGMMLLAAARDLMVLFLALELMSLAVYVLAGINRRSARSAEGALKYFLLGSFSTGFLLYGIALVYGATGSTELSAIAYAITGGLHGREMLLRGGIALLMIGFAFKVSAVPFHMWAPDVYEGAPTPITAYMAAGVKAAAFAAFLRVWTEAFQESMAVWRGPLMVIAIATMVVGSLIALPQRNVKRMLAYSSIVHSGYILVAVLAVSAIGRSAFLFYLLSYTLATIGSFAVVSAVSAPNEGKLKLADYSGLWRERPWMALAMGIYLLALLGFPIFGGTGFLAKWYMLNASLTGPAKMPGVATALVLTSCVSAGFYLYLVTLMFMKERPADGRVAPTGGITRFLIGATAVAILLLGVFSNPLVQWAEQGAPMKGAAGGTVVRAAPGK